MFYECKNCGSKKKPKIIKYFPPIEVACWDCNHIGKEKEFITSNRAALSLSSHF